MPPAQLVYAAGHDFALRGSFKAAPGPRPVHLLVRGDIDKPADLIGPATLRCLPDLSGDLAISDPSRDEPRRAALARWLSDRRNVLTWRSIVNRTWHYHFGRGLVETPNDFGHMGGLPSHPELLDWLAVWFRDDAQGSLKQLHRLIVTSQTYRQSPAGGTSIEDDQENRLLGRFSRRRLAAEEIRDAVLQLSGQLDLTMDGAPAVQFVDHAAATFNPVDGSPPFVDYENFDPDHPANRRRAIYRFLFRTVPDPLLDTFDCPDGGAAAPVRGASTTAVQALTLLNNGFLIRQAEHLAARLAQSASGPEEQVEAACGEILTCAPHRRRATGIGRLLPAPWAGQLVPLIAQQ